MSRVRRPALAGPAAGRPAALAAVLLALVGSGAGAASAGQAVPVAPPSRAAGATVAKVVVETAARSLPGAGAVVWRVPTATTWGDGPQQLLVLDSALDDAGRGWLRVLLPIRPNGTTGWVRLDHVAIGRTPYWIEVSVGSRRVDVYRQGRVARSFGAVVGAPGTPTPRGLAALYDPIAQPDPRGFLGPWVLHLTSFSDILDNYGGGPGRVAIHGRGGASLNDPIGSARSHGCIRIDNNQIRWLVRVPRGTPVRITR